MAKGVTISLAAKCQLLFGLAVLVIIAGALAVPWQRMEQLAGQTNIKAARYGADMVFRQIHAGMSPIPAAPSTAPATATSPTTAPRRLNWDDISLLDIANYPPPRVIRLSGPADAAPSADPIAREALDAFRTTRDSEYGRVMTADNNARIYRYAAAIRLDKSCLACHTEWTSWVRPPATTSPSAATLPAIALPPATEPTTRPAAPLAPANWPVVGMIRVDVPWQIDDTQLLLNRIVIVVAGMLGGTLAIVVFYLITSRLILQPVRVLKNTAEKVSKGDLNIRSAISTGDEFQQLSETFNTMLATLKASQDQLESTNRSLDSRVGELARSNVDLFEANKVKSEFLTNVSHELRTPLNAIIGFTDLLSDNPAIVGSKSARYLENVRTSAKQLLDLINDLLDLAKIEAGKIVLRDEKLNVADVCEAMVNFMRPLAAKKNIDLSFTTQPDIPLVSTDPGRFQQVLYNFLSNAVKFTPNDGKIQINARMDDPAHVRVAVTDTGPGIPPEYHDAIFEKFRQVDSGITRQHSGSGLGLAISKELARMLGGTIELTSTPGKGATFALIIPVTLTQHTIEMRHNTPPD